ncbi:conserved protein of unknown function [Tenacibaculum sp. 190524A02b]|uniref:terminase small subunit n=1 Tax=Tenacibaculum vairaonense TaxID=3137860 RepID=UPI0032B1B0D7
MKESTLERYKLIIDEWFNNGFNGAQAYKKFYPNNSRADDSFSKIQSLPEVELYIKAKNKKAQKELDVTHQEVLKELHNWAYSDITQTISLTPSGVEALPEEIRRLITKYKKTTKKIGEDITEEVIELHFVSKEKAMEMIAKHIGFYEKDNSQKKNDNVVMFRLPENGRE